MREDLGFRNTTPLLWLRHRCAEAAWCKRMTRAGLALSRWGVTATLSICFFMSYLDRLILRSEEHTSELQSLMRISYAVFCLKQKKSTKYKKVNIHNVEKKHLKILPKIITV